MIPLSSNDEIKFAKSDSTSLISQSKSRVIRSNASTIVLLPSNDDSIKYDTLFNLNILPVLVLNTK